MPGLGVLAARFGTLKYGKRRELGRSLFQRWRTTSSARHNKTDGMDKATDLSCSPIVSLPDMRLQKKPPTL